MDIEKGFCQCGCGRKTENADQNDKKRGWIKGEPVRFVKGHRPSQDKGIYGERKLCECGCGGLANLAARNLPKYGWIKGQPLRYIKGHQPRGASEDGKRRIAEANRGKTVPLEQRIRMSRTHTGREPILSPYILEGVLIALRDGPSHKGQPRWYGWSPLTKKSTAHARMVWEYNNGPVPEGLEVHHINGKCSSLEDDRLENLTVISKDWNMRYLPLLAFIFKIEEAQVTKVYLEEYSSGRSDAEIFKAIVKKL